MSKVLPAFMYGNPETAAIRNEEKKCTGCKNLYGTWVECSVAWESGCWCGAIGSRKSERQEIAVLHSLNGLRNVDFRRMAICWCYFGWRASVI